LADQLLAHVRPDFDPDTGLVGQARAATQAAACYTRFGIFGKDGNNDQSSAEPVWRDSSPLGRGRARSSPGNRAAGRSSSGAPEAAA
jgi:hypothetical protein